MKTNQGKSRLTILIVVAVLAVIGTDITLRLVQAHHFPPALRGFAVAPKPIGTVHLVDKNNQALLDNYFKDKWTLVFFGYTNCPDVCPSTLMQMKQLYSSIRKAPGSNQYQFLFISVDPARDNVTRLKSFIEYFDKDFDAASGDIGHIKTFEKVFGAFHHYAKKSKDDMHYSVAHSAEVYIVSPRERFVGKFLPPINVNKLTIKLSKLTAYVQQQGGKA